MQDIGERSTGGLPSTIHVASASPIVGEIERPATLQPLANWVHSGSLKIARWPRDAEVIKADFERGRRMGLDVELISPERASLINPFLKPTGVVAAMRIGDDRYFDPAQIAIGYTRAAAARGATLLPKTDALAVNIRAGKVTGVTTAKGTIEAPVVVDAAGGWTRQGGGQWNSCTLSYRRASNSSSQSR
jgi:glycine/D-amino acid oxidase-like deaminating enzyme